MFYVVVRDLEYKIIETTLNRGVPSDTSAVSGDRLFSTKLEAELFAKFERRRIFDSIDTC